MLIILPSLSSLRRSGMFFIFRESGVFFWETLYNQPLYKTLSLSTKVWAKYSGSVLVWWIILCVHRAAELDEFKI